MCKAWSFPPTSSSNFRVMNVESSTASVIIKSIWTACTPFSAEVTSPYVNTMNNKQDSCTHTTQHNSCQMKTKHGCFTTANMQAKCHQLETLQQQIICLQSTCVLWIMASKFVTMCSWKQKKRNVLTTTAQKVGWDS
jgi:hypothetical protein